MTNGTTGAARWLAALLATLAMAGCDRDMEGVSAQVVAYGPGPNVTIEVRGPEGARVMLGGIVPLATVDASGVARFEEPVEPSGADATNHYLERDAFVFHETAWIDVPFAYPRAMIAQLPRSGAVVAQDDGAPRVGPDGQAHVWVLAAAGDHVTLAGQTVAVDENGFGQGTVDVSQALASLVHGEPTEVTVPLVSHDGEAVLSETTATLALPDGLDPFLHRWMDREGGAAPAASPARGILWRPYRPERVSTHGLRDDAVEPAAGIVPAFQPAFVLVGDPGRWATQWVATEASEEEPIRRCYGPMIYGVTRHVSVRDAVTGAVVAERIFPFSRRDTRCNVRGVVDLHRPDIHARAADAEVEAWLESVLARLES